MYLFLFIESPDERCAASRFASFTDAVEQFRAERHTRFQERQYRELFERALAGDFGREECTLVAADGERIVTSRTTNASVRTPSTDRIVV